MLCGTQVPQNIGTLSNKHNHITSYYTCYSLAAKLHQHENT